VASNIVEICNLRLLKVKESQAQDEEISSISFRLLISVNLRLLISGLDRLRITPRFSSKAKRSKYRRRNLKSQVARVETKAERLKMISQFIESPSELQEDSVNKTKQVIFSIFQH
jgi:predicted Holliday junction resolvase-like endonuclease